MAPAEGEKKGLKNSLGECSGDNVFNVSRSELSRCLAVRTEWWNVRRYAFQHMLGRLCLYIFEVFYCQIQDLLPELCKCVDTSI